jgi:hypothetical protein
VSASILTVVALAVPACSSNTLIEGEATAETVNGVIADNSFQGGQDVPDTLGAATAAAQADIDRFTAGDFAFVWQHMTEEVRTAIPQADFVTYYRTCKTIGPKLSVAGIALDDDRATVQVTGAHTTTGYRVMVYEAGEWNMAPTDAFKQHLGQPVQQLIDEETSNGLCAH